MTRIFRIVHKERWGILFHLTSFWIGVHYSVDKKRTCINLIPMLTVWVIEKNGERP